MSASSGSRFSRTTLSAGGQVGLKQEDKFIDSQPACRKSQRGRAWAEFEGQRAF